MAALQEKLALYHALLMVPDHRLSDNETDILYSLSKDADVQAHLQRCIDADKLRSSADRS